MTISEQKQHITAISNRSRYTVTTSNFSHNQAYHNKIFDHAIGDLIDDSPDFVKLLNADDKAYLDEVIKYVYTT